MSKLDRKTFETMKAMAAKIESAPWSYNQLRQRFENADGDGDGHWWYNGPTDDFVVCVRNNWDEIEAILAEHFAQDDAPDKPKSKSKPKRARKGGNNDGQNPREAVC